MKTYLKSFALCLLFFIPTQTEAIVQEVQPGPESQMEQWEGMFGKRLKKDKLVKKIKRLKKRIAAKTIPDEPPHLLNILSLVFGIGSGLALLIAAVALIILILSAFSGELLGVGILLVCLILALLFSILAIVLGALGIKKPGKAMGIAGMILGGITLISFLLSALS